MSRIIGASCRILLLLVAGSLLVLPGLTAQALAQTPSPATDESEPNNRLSQATVIAVPGQVQGRINPVGDVDWYAFSVPQDGEVQISVTGVAANLAINVQVYNADTQLISNWIGPKDKGGDTAFALDLPEAGRYYLLLADSYSDASSPQPYALAITFTPAVDAGESNNSLSKATPLEIGTPRSATIFPRGDVDWYAFSAPQDGEVQISVTGVAANLAINAQVYNASAQLISNWVGPKDKGGDTTFALDLPAAGRYYLLLADDYSDERSLQAYSVAVTFTPAVDAGEPNNRLQDATQLELEKSNSATVFPTGDVDWYSFSIPQDGEVQISVTDVAADLAINVQVYNADTQLISNWIGPKDKGGDTTFALDLPAAGRYYLLLADDFSDARSLQAYSVAVTFTPAVDAGEPNNRLSYATPLELGTPRSATIFPKGDVDWYQFEVAGPGKLQAAITKVADLGLNFQTFNADGGLISNWIGPQEKGGDTVATVDLPEAGRYYVVVADDYSDARSVQPYTITATFTPGVAP